MKDQEPAGDREEAKQIPAEKDRTLKSTPDRRDRDRDQDTECDTAEPQPGIGQYQGGGIEDAIGGGTSGQGGG